MTAVPRAKGEGTPTELISVTGQNFRDLKDINSAVEREVN